ncbi:MAG: tRNA glutamyl-Q(34) synthetase GluQRS [Planctomycetota bacterium]
MSQPSITRFAPSPTGLLHRGHAFSALAAWDLARSLRGEFLLRIEDIDTTRCRPEFEVQLKTDLQWLGLNWPEPVRRQSEHLPEYRAVAEQLLERGLLYPCFCTRRDIQREIAAAGGAPHGLEGPLYPGTCRSLLQADVSHKMNRGEQYALRLNLERARNVAPAELTWFDLRHGPQIARPECLGDVVLVRKDIGCSYHLCVVLDDALQKVTHISRGEDLFEATHLHRLLQALLDLPVPVYSHHSLIQDASGRRLAKRDGAESLQALRDQGVRPEELREQLRAADLP